MSAAGSKNNINENANVNNIIFTTIKDTNLHVTAQTWRGFERLFYWDKYKTKKIK